ncbi:MAG: hypothetical protein ACK4UP_06190 [Spirosomataceae bacterium]
MNTTIDDRVVIRRVQVTQSRIKTLKKGFYLFFILLLTEGGLRKWALPSLSDALLIVRDPVAIWMLVYCLKHGILKNNIPITLSLLVSGVSVITALAIGHGNIFVALYGARIFVIYVPLLYLFGQILTRDDVLEVGKWLIYSSIPMTLIMIAQFYSPQSAWINRGVGGNMEGAGFSGALGYYRPSGTFSFISGLANYYSVVFPFILYAWIERENIRVKGYILIAATSLYIAAIPYSISRSILITTMATLLFYFVFVIKDRKKIGQAVGVVITLVGILGILIASGAVSTGLEAFLARFEAANQGKGVEESIIGRFVNSLFGPISNLENLPFWGVGIGLGTNAGAKLATGSNVFLVAEEEWGRLLGEMGILGGLTMIVIRLKLGMELLLQSFQRIKKNPLPWLLASSIVLHIIQAQWAQPTSLGVSVLGGGLLIASLKR